jgi:hypothetical protein
VPKSSSAIRTLQDEAGRRQSAVVEGGPNVGDELIVVELVRRDIDADAQVLGARQRAPFHRLATRFAQDEAADFDDEPGLLGDGDELVGPDQTAGGVVPTYERLEGFDRLRLEIEQRLVMHDELAVLQRVPEITVQRVASRQLRLHRGFEHLDPVAAPRLRGVHGDIGAAEKLVGVECVGAVVGDPD